MTHPDDLTLQSWYDDALPDALRGEFAPHLEDCAACAQRLASLGVVSRASRQWLDAVPALPDDFTELLMARIAREADSPVVSAPVEPPAAESPRALAPVVPLRSLVKAQPSRRWVYPALAAAAAGLIAVRVAIPRQADHRAQQAATQALVGGEGSGGAKVTRVDVPGAQSFTVMQLPGARPDTVTAVVWIQDHDEPGATP